MYIGDLKNVKVVKVKINLSLCTSWKPKWEDIYMYRYTFLSSALDGGEWWASRPGRWGPIPVEI